MNEYESPSTRPLKPQACFPFFDSGCEAEKSSPFRPITCSPSPIAIVNMKGSFVQYWLSLPPKFELPFGLMKNSRSTSPYGNTKAAPANTMCSLFRSIGSLTYKSVTRKFPGSYITRIHLPEDFISFIFHPSGEDGMLKLWYMTCSLCNAKNWKSFSVGTYDNSG